MADGRLSAEELGRRFVDAFNRRDADALVALCHTELEFVPTLLVGQRSVFLGHDGMRRWVAELIASGASHEVSVRKVRVLGDARFVVLTEVRIEDEAITQSAMVADTKDGLILRAKAYLSDERTLIRVGVLPPADD